VLDLGRVRYVDSAGLGELVQAFSAVRTRGGEMKLLNVTKRLNNLLVVTRLLTVFDCYDQEADALAGFDAQPASH
jgi:anti-sigma B factor antagonist